MFRLELFLNSQLPLMKSAELVDLVLVLPSDFNLVSRGLGLVLFRELQKYSQRRRILS